MAKKTTISLEELIQSVESHPEVKRKAIEAASPNVLPPEQYSENQKEEMMEWLRSLI